MKEREKWHNVITVSFSDSFTHLAFDRHFLRYWGVDCNLVFMTNEIWQIHRKVLSCSDIVNIIALAGA